MTQQAVRPYVNTVLLSLLGGALAFLLSTPLPWMIGAMLAMAAARLFRIQVSQIAGMREAGQLIIGTAIGLYFTPAVLQHVSKLLVPMLAVGFGSIVIGFLSGRVLARMTGVSGTTAFFSCVPGGAAEMVILGHRYGANVDFVAIGQALRMMLVVLVVPFSLAFFGAQGGPAPAPGQAGIHVPGLVLLLAASVGAALLLRRLQAPTPWMLGPLLCSCGITASGISWSAMPMELSAMAQAFIGCSLGIRFSREFLIETPRHMAAVCTSTLVTLILSALLGLFICWAIDAPWLTMVLATAPGGIAEMSVTAKVLHLDVAVVTSFHVVRLVILLVATAPIFRYARRLAGTTGAAIEKP